MGACQGQTFDCSWKVFVGVVGRTTWVQLDDFLGVPARSLGVWLDGFLRAWEDGFFRLLRRGWMNSWVSLDGLFSVWWDAF